MTSGDSKLLVKLYSCVLDNLLGLEAHPVIVPVKERPRQHIVYDVATPLADAL